MVRAFWVVLGQPRKSPGQALGPSEEESLGCSLLLPPNIQTWILIEIRGLLSPWGWAAPLTRPILRSWWQQVPRPMESQLMEPLQVPRCLCPRITSCLFDVPLFPSSLSQIRAAWSRDNELR